MTIRTRPARTTEVVVSVPGKGTLDASFSDPYSCDPTSGAATADYTITGGSGSLQGASGSGTVTNTGTPPNVTDTWAGTIDAPSYQFDLTPPTLKGPRSIERLAPRHATHLRLRYTVTATDATDGPVPVRCKPRSGSRFKIGRTRVACKATDHSANTATLRFTVTIKHRR